MKSCPTLVVPCGIQNPLVRSSTLSRRVRIRSLQVISIYHVMVLCVYLRAHVRVCWCANMCEFGFRIIIQISYIWKLSMAPTMYSPSPLLAMETVSDCCSNTTQLRGGIRPQFVRTETDRLCFDCLLFTDKYWRVNQMWI